MKLRIESDGTRRNTKLLIDGEGKSVEIEGVDKITWEFAQDDELVTATVKFKEVGLSTVDCAKDTL